MHAATVHLIPILGAEKSKTAFYVAGALLVAWALFVSVGLGMRNDDFPATTTASRAVIGLTVLLVAATAITAIITSGGSTTSTASAGTTTATSAQPPPGTPAEPPGGGTPAPAGTTTSTSSAATSKSTAPAAPTATTGTPAPASSPAAAAPAAPLQLAANPEGQLSYNTKQLTAKAGKVTITMANASPVPHNVTIAQGSTMVGATPTFQGGSKSVTVTLKPGTYTFYCSVPGHRQAGMEGTLTVA